MNDQTQPTHFLEHPEVKEYLCQYMPILISESDRGAVLLGLSYIDELLADFYDKLLPTNVSKKKRKSALRSFQNFSTKINIALACRLLPYSLITTINKLQDLRNTLAHITGPFEFSTHQQQLREMYSLLGDGLATWINRTALDLRMNQKIDQVIHSEEGSTYFKNKYEVVEFLGNNQDLVEDMERQQPRWEFALCIMLIFAMIIYHREKVLSLVGDKTLSELA